MKGPIIGTAACASYEPTNLCGLSSAYYDFSDAPIVTTDAPEPTNAAYSAKPAWSPTDVPPGQQYSWMETFRMSPEDRARHVSAMNDEINKQFAAGGGWDYLPEGATLEKSIGVCRLKQHDLHGGAGEIKARFCVNGKQTEVPSGGWETTANVASVAQILTVIAIANERDMKLKQIDVKSAFTQVKLPEGQHIWVQPLPGIKDPEGKGRVIRLDHHIYCHPLANAAWAKKWTEILTEYGFTAVDREGTVFVYDNENDKIIVSTVVDDSVVAYDNEAKFNDFLKHVKRHVPIDVADLEHICGLRVTRDLRNGTISVDQTEYIEQKASQFGITEGGHVYKTPMETDFKLGERPATADVGLVKLARSLNGSLIYATLTRPECKYPCSKLASITINPTEDDTNAMRRVLKYLYDTRNTKLTFTKGPWTGPDGTTHEPNQLVVYVDAGFAQESERRSQTGFVMMLNGAAIFAKSGRQTQLADSTGYAETIALHEATHWVVGYRRLLANLGFTQKVPTPIYEDSSSAVAFAKQGMGQRSLHYEVKYLYVTELEKSGEISVRKIDTKQQIADVLTKPVAWDTAKTLVKYMLGSDLVFTGSS